MPLKTGILSLSAPLLDRSSQDYGQTLLRQHARPDMSTYRSDSSSTVTDSRSYGTSRQSAKRETRAMRAMIKQDMRLFREECSESSKKKAKRPTEARNRAFVAVCSRQSVSRLSAECRNLGRKWYQILRIIVTAEVGLQSILNGLEDDEYCHELVLVVSGNLSRIEFHVPSNISVLLVLRCSLSRPDEGRLFVDGHSTFRETELQDWAGMDHKKRSVFFGPGTVVTVDPRSKAWQQSTESLRRNLNPHEKENIRRRVDEMKATRTEGGNWWDKWSGSLAAILGILAGGSKLVAQASAAVGGTLVDFNCGLFSLKVAKASAGISGIATAAGPAVLVGLGVAAAIYFIPWKELFEWLGRIVSWLPDAFATIWETFKSWLANRRIDEPKHFESRRMSF
ncbi:hypothetical protein CPLU01_12537 [Colletotrichum plurivorum]|uniref:Uncharacterized protein n=1 Tax=Colletotrichum plurivorum TaxID=2175906 RepID=A0A8H6N6H1_9PEZI|nr:hypothetical protein CPLU01_12537 [Colletotrichum plurivorum]